MTTKEIKHYFAGATMGNDLGARNEDNSPALRAAKNQIEELINEWIDEFNN